MRCLSHLCDILIGQSDIVKVLVFFQPSQFTNHIATHTEQVLPVSKTDLDFVRILKPCLYFKVDPYFKEIVNIRNFSKSFVDSNIYKSCQYKFLSLYSDHCFEIPIIVHIL